MEAIEPDEVETTATSDAAPSVVPPAIDLAANLGATAALWAMRRIAPATAPMPTKIAVYVGFAALGVGLGVLTRGAGAAGFRGMVHGAGGILTSGASGAAMNEAGRAVVVAVLQKRGWRKQPELA